MTDETHAKQREMEQRWGQWMAQAQQGDGKAYERLLREILPVLRGFVNARMSGLAISEDVVQNILLSIHRSRHTFRPEQPFGPWMRAVARNAVADAYRARSRREQREEPLEGHDLVAAEIAEPIAGAALSPHLVSALRSLSPIQREAVELLHLRELPLREAAAMAGVTPNALKVRAHRGRQAMRARLEHDRWELEQ